MGGLIMEPVLDPRGVPKRPIVKLAKRVAMDDLRRGPVLFYDNTKLSFCNYFEVFSRIKENFAREGITISISARRARGFRHRKGFK